MLVVACQERIAAFKIELPQVFLDDCIGCGHSFDGHAEEKEGGDDEKVGLVEHCVRWVCTREE